MILSETGDLVADVGLIPTTVEGVSEIELGWITRKPWWGMGIATEAAAAWRDYAFLVAGLDRIVSMISDVNIASQRVAEKIGETYERDAVWMNNSMRMYSLSRQR